MNKKHYTYVFFITLIFTFILIVNYLINPVIGSDSGFYLSVARDLYDGKVYFQDIGISYNPLSIVLFGLPYLFMDNPPYIFHLILNITTMVLSSFAFYRILSLLNKNVSRNRLFSIVLLLLFLVLDGKHIMLEPLSVFLLLLALLNYLKYTNNNKLYFLFLTGLFISLSFFSKQYGLFLAIPIGIDIVIKKTIIIKRVFFLSIGFITPILILFIYFYSIGMNLADFILNILGKGFIYNTGNGTGLKTSFFSYYVDVIYIVLFNLYFILIPYLLFKNKFLKQSLFYFTVFFSSLLVLAFANYWHYYQYIVPFSLLLYTFLTINNKHKTKYDISIIVSLFFLISYSVLITKDSYLHNKEIKKNTALLLKYIPSESSVYFDGLSATYYYTCKYHSIDLKKIGYTFSGFFSPKYLINKLDKGEYLIISNKKYISYRKEITLTMKIKKIYINNTIYILLTK